MSLKAEAGESRQGSGRLWYFANCEFDESSRQLRVDGALVDLEGKPLEVLYRLLLHAGEVLTKDELLDAVWPGVTVVEGSLTTAVSKLRKALGEEAIVLTVPRIGYRLGVPVHSKVVYAPGVPDLHLEKGGAVPGRDQWQLTGRLDASDSSEVWIAEHPKTRERRVFKFAADGVRLRSLRREVTLARLLRESLGERADLARVLEWNFDTPPFYVESEFGGINLLQWAESHGGLHSIPLTARLRVLIDTAKAVAAAHQVGVLHKDLKPANVLITPLEGSGHQVKVVDFGSGTLADLSRLDELGITNMGFTQSGDSDANALTGTLVYMAPEVLAGHAATVQADVYALGVMLYQMAAGDFRKPLSAGWEGDIADPLIRDDIAAAAAGDPLRRLDSVAALAERLEKLETRRTARAELESAMERARLAEERLARARARGPWVVAAGVALTAGLAASLTLYWIAGVERDRANRQTAIATEVNRFLANDLIGRSNPFQSGKSTETLAEALQRASPDIDRQFHDSPEVAARLHQAIANAFDNRTDYAQARKEYAQAAELFDKAGSEYRGEAVVARVQLAAMEARTYSEGSLERAKSLLAEQERALAGLSSPPAELPVWLASARGMIALIGNDAKTASDRFQSAFDAASRLDGFDDMARLTMKQRLAFAQIRLGNGARAEQLFRELIGEFTQLRGPQDPSVLRVRLNLAQALMIQNKHKEAVSETTAIYPAYLEKLGADHELTMQVLTTRAQSEGSLGMWDDAIRDDLTIHEIAVRKQGPQSFFAIATLSDAALAQCRAGRTREGEANARRAYGSSARGFGPTAGLTGGVAHTLASCLILLDKLDEAAGLLAGIDRKAVAQLAGSQDWGAGVDLSLAEIAYKRKDYGSARKYLELAEPAFRKPEAEEYQRKVFQALKTGLGGK